MWAYVKDNEVRYYISRPMHVVIDGIQHSEQIFTSWSKEELADIGIYKVVSEVKKKPFRIPSGKEEIIDHEKHVVTRKLKYKSPNLKELKEQLIDGVRKDAKTYLDKTDWYVTREYETGKKMPDDVRKLRESIREEADTKIEAIENAKKISEIDHLHDVGILKPLEIDQLK